MIKSIQVVNRFRMELVLNKMYPTPKNPFAVISIYSSPKEELITLEKSQWLNKQGCVRSLSMLFEDGSIDDTWIKYPFQVAQAQEVIRFLDDVNGMDEEIFLILHCDAGISRSGAVATFASNYLDIPFHDAIIQPNPYVLRTLNNQVWSQKYEND